jgi:hypothetical protein
MLDGMASTSRSTCIESIISLENMNEEEHDSDSENEDDLTKNPYHNVKSKYQTKINNGIFLLVLSNGTFLAYSVFDGRCIEVKSKDLYMQNIMFNRQMFKQSIQETAEGNL